MNRRTFITTVAAAVAAATQTAAKEKTEFRTRGIVIMPADVPGMGWPARCAKAGIHTIALHEFHAWPLLRFVLDREGQTFLAQCREQRIEVEYELHLMADLLERWRFEEGDRDFFRMDVKGQRNPDVNLCVSYDRALGIVAQNAAALSRILKPTTGRHFYWGDDGGRWCQCPQCRDLSDSARTSGCWSARFVASSMAVARLKSCICETAVACATATRSGLRRRRASTIVTMI